MYKLIISFFLLSFIGCATTPQYFIDKDGLGRIHCREYKTGKFTDMKYCK